MAKVENNITEDKVTIEKYGVFFDSDTFVLQGYYEFELAQRRALKNWTQAIEDCLLLTNQSDFKVSYCNDLNSFRISCEFVSATGKYAFWKLINGQAPDAQYQIEIAHIPNGKQNRDLVVSAPDLQSIKKTNHSKDSIINWIMAQK